MIRNSSAFRLCAYGVVCALSVASSASTQDASRAKARDRAGTAVLVNSYGQAKHWALRGITLLALGPDWHPVGSEMLVAALREKDMRLRSFAISALRATSDAALPKVMTPALIDELVKKQLGHKNKYYRGEVLKLLSRGVEADAKTKSQRKSWWSKNRTTWLPPKWVAAPKEDKKGEGGTVASAIVKRAFDLNAAGLDVAIVIDSTGSMQQPIDAARDAVGEIVAMLSGVAPKFRLGLVHYKDFNDMSDGARILVPLTNGVEKVRTKLARLVASGGGDIPERVEKGLEMALNSRMKWRKGTNKVIILIGDAPPHASARPVAIQLAKDAYERPFVMSGKRRTAITGGSKKAPPRPFVTSAIGIGAVARQDDFKQIAKAGGGAFATMNAGGGPGADANPGASQAVVRHILTLAFGSRFKREMNAFIDVYYEFRREKFFK